MIKGIIEAALEYKKKGWSVIPIHPNIKDPIGTWKKYQKRIASDDEIKKWFTSDKDYNLGIVCGEVSNNLEILDLDDPELLEFFKNIKTYQVETQSKGYHLYFKVKKLSGNKRQLHGYPIDIRSNGGFGMAPPSQMNNGGWKIIREDEILEIDNVITFAKDHLPNKEKHSKKEAVFIENFNIKDIIAKYCKVERKGKIWQVLCPFHEDHTPSLTIYDDNYYCFGCGAHGDVIEFIKRYKKLENRHAAIELLEELTGKKYEGKLKTNKLQNYTSNLIEKWNIVTVEETQEILRYENGVYIKAENAILKDFSDSFGVAEINKEAGILSYIRNMTYKSDNAFDKDPYIINLKNGLYYIKEKKLMPHTPDYLSLVQIPINYIDEAKCLLTDKFISEIASKNGQRTLWELLGYCLFSDKITQQFFLLYGSGANGKSVYMDMLGELVGEENTVRISFDSIEMSRFVVAELKNKLLNISSETVVAKVKNIDQMKRLTGEHKIEGEIKFVQGRIKFESKATCVYGMNEIPAFENPIYAETRRMVFINFPTQFKRANADPYLLKKLTSKEEQEGQLVKGLNYLENTLKTKQVYDPLTEDEKEDLLEKSSNQVNAFLEDEFAWEIEDEVESVWIHGECLYKMLESYCKQNNLITPSNHKFKLLLKKEHQKTFDKYDNTLKINNIHHAIKKLNTKQMRVWKLAPLQKYSFVTEEKNRDDLKFWH